LILAFCFNSNNNSNIKMDPSVRWDDEQEQ